MKRWTRGLESLPGSNTFANYASSASFMRAALDWNSRHNGLLSRAAYNRCEYLQSRACVISRAIVRQRLQLDNSASIFAESTSLITPSIFLWITGFSGTDAPVFHHQVTPFEIRNHPACLTHDDRSRRNVPGRKPLLPKAVQPPGSHIGKVECGSPHPPDAGCFQHESALLFQELAM